MDMSPADETFPKPSTKPRKLQKRSRQLPAQVTADNDHSPSLPSHKSLPSPGSKLPQPSVTAASRAKDLKTHIPRPSRAFTKDATKPRPIRGYQTSEGEAFKTTPKPRVSTERNVSNADSGVVLSPVNSPTQTSPATQRAESTADSAVGPSPSTTSAVGPKRGDKTTKASPTTPAGKRKERQIPVPSGAFKYPSAPSDAMANSYGPSYPVSHGHAWRPKSGNSSCCSPLRESTYPMPLANSPLTDTALVLRKTTHDGNISTDSSSSSLGRLLSRVSQKPGSPKRPDHFPAAVPPTLLQHSSALGGHSPLPYEAIEAGEPPIHVGAPVTPTVIAYATTPVEALPGVRDDSSVQTAKKRSGKAAAGLWSLFRKRSKSSAGVKRSQHPWGLRRSSTTGDSSAHFSDRTIYGVPNDCFDDDYSRKIGLHAEGERHQRGHGIWQSIRPRAPQSSNDSWPSFDGTRPTQPASPHTNKQLPPFPHALTRPTLGRAPPNTGRESRDSLTETDEDNQIKRHRRRALFALDGVTYTGGSGSRRSFLPQTPNRENETHPSQHRRPPPPPPPPHAPRSPKHALPPQPREAVASSTDDTSALNSSPHNNRMSEEVKREFMQRGKETEARVAQHARTFEGAAAEGWRLHSRSSSPAPSSSSSGSGLEMQVNYRAPEHVRGSFDSLGTINAPIVSAHQAGMAWWEVGEGLSEDRPKSDETETPDKKAVLEQAVVDLEHAAAEAVVGQAGDAGDNVGERSSTRPTQQQDQAARQALTRSTQLRASQQHRAEQDSYLRGRQLTRDTFRRHRECGRWDFTQQQHGSSAEANDTPEEQQKQTITVHVSHAKLENACPLGGPSASSNDNGDSSTGSSSTSLRSTALRNGKPPRPFMNAYEAAHAVQSTPASTLSQRSLGLSTEQKQLLRPAPLSLTERAPVKSVFDGHGGHDHPPSSGKPDAVSNAGAVKTQRRPPPPPPPQTPKAAIPVAVAPGTESLTRQETVTPQRRRPPPPPPPPIPPKSGFRPRLLGGDWSVGKMQGLKHDILRSSVAQRPNLHTVVEEVAERRPSTCSRRSSEWTDVRIREIGVDDGGESESETGSERFWSDDEGDDRAGTEGESNETTPEKMASAGWHRGTTRKDGLRREHSDDENQVVDYYLNAQREEEERNRRVAEEEARRVEEAETARKRENEARRLRVANLMARVRAGAMD